MSSAAFSLLITVSILKVMPHARRHQHATAYSLRTLVAAAAAAADRGVGPPVELAAAHGQDIELAAGVRARARAGNSSRTRLPLVTTETDSRPSFFLAEAARLVTAPGEAVVDRNGDFAGSMAASAWFVMGFLWGDDRDEDESDDEEEEEEEEEDDVLEGSI
ncbi:hypothetical protein MFIFM68171_08938 [Madurella fahalii]|uniref:Uncharacterized protein n=1 Tax=Madurella fahalii TaxID=1157608 RepID=A0ABQ0GLT9_9PEZI